MGSSSNWTWEQNKQFENALLMYEKDPERWQKIGKITGKTVEEVKTHYQKLVDDVNAIEAGRVPLPNYERNEGKERIQNEKKK